MKKTLTVLAAVSLVWLCPAKKQETQEQQSSLKVEVGAQRNKKTKILCVPLGLQDTFQEAGEALQRACNYTQQLEIDIKNEQSPYKKKEVLALKDAGYAFVLFVTQDKKKSSYEWRLYDTHKASMQSGFIVKKQGNLPRGWGYALADSLVPVLTSNKPFACSKLTYCQKGKKGDTLVYVADFDGTNPEVLTQSKRAIIAPRWNRDPEQPVVLYSKYTPINIQLISHPLEGHEVVSASFDGLNMLPAFSFDGKEVVVCLSRDGSSQLYAYGYNQTLKKVGYTRLTYNTGNNISPTFLPNGNIVFCSDFELGRPQLYLMDRKDDSIVRLTEGAACSSCQYSDVAQKVAYSKLENGVMQIFTYDFETKKEKQITFDRGHKQECSWSACGNYLAYGVVDGKNQRIASHSLVTGKSTFLTPEDTVCTYPSWSGLYATFPVVKRA